MDIKRLHHLETLAGLSLSDAERRDLVGDLQRILDFADLLPADEADLVQTDPPTQSPLPEMRQAVPGQSPWLPQTPPHWQDAFFIVPTTRPPRDPEAS